MILECVLSFLIGALVALVWGQRQLVRLMRAES
jgi:hypothetical protein